MTGWRRVRIGDFLHRVKHPVRLRDDETYKLVTVRMHHNGVVLRETKKGKLIGSNMYQVRSGQFILSGIDARHGAFGVIPEELDGAVVTNDFWYFDVDDAVVARDFFLWLTTTPLFLDACIKSSEGTTNRRRLQAERFFNFAFRFPDITEQHRLARRFAAFDATHSALKGEFDLQSDFLKQLRQAVLQEAVEGKLTADWRTKNLPRPQGGNYDFPPPFQGEGRGGDGVKGDPNYDAAALLAQIKAEKEKLVKAGKIKKEKPQPPIDESDKPFELPAGWVWCRLGGDLASVGTGATPQTTDSSYYENGTINWVTSSATNQPMVTQAEKKITEKALLETNCKVFPVGTLVVAMYGQGKTRGQITELGIPAATNQACAAIQLYNTSPAHKRYVTLCFQKQYEEIRELATGGSQPNLNMEKIKVTQVPLPPLAEQQAIVARVDSLMAMIDDLEQQVTERKEQAQMLMQAVLREAFVGGEEAKEEDACVGATHASPDYSSPRATRARHVSPRRESTNKTRRAGLEPAHTEGLPLVAETSGAYTSSGQPALYAANQPLPGGIPARILAAMHPGRDYSRADLLAAAGISEADWIWAIRQLKEQGRVVQRGEKRGARYLLR